MIVAYQEALMKCCAAVAGMKLGVEKISLAESVGRVCAQEVRAPLSIQPFDNAAMDGYALRHADIAEASLQKNIKLKIAGTIAAGDAVSSYTVEAGQCMKIMTGAPMPQGADVVVPFECAREEDGYAVFTQRAALHDHVRFAGEDFTEGDVVLSVGTSIKAQHILPLATLGISDVVVFKKPRIAFLATGRELVDDLEASLVEGEIYNSNRPYALAALTAMGADVVRTETIRDEAAAFEQALQACLETGVDFIISSGAVSAGDFDFVRPCLEKIGAVILYHKVKMKPGKPNLLARLPNGTLYFGLPGNPVATAVGLHFFVKAALEKIVNLPSEKPMRAVAINGFPKKAGLHMFLKGYWETNDEGCAVVTFLEGQASFMVRPFLEMNCWIMVPEDKGTVGVGEIVEIYPV